jgi:hypothetical protein
VSPPPHLTSAPLLLFVTRNKQESTLLEDVRTIAVSLSTSVRFEEGVAGDRHQVPLPTVLPSIHFCRWETNRTDCFFLPPSTRSFDQRNEFIHTRDDKINGFVALTEGRLGSEVGWGVHALKPVGGRLLGGRVLGDGLRALGDGVLGQLAGQDQPHGGLHLAGRDRRLLVVLQAEER